MSGMYYLFFQIWLWLLISFVLGFFVARWFCCRNHESDSEESNNVTAVASAPVETKATVAPTKPAAPAISDSWKPTLFAQAPDSVDDIKRIKGIGAVIEKTLNELGVYQFEQIANWDSNNCAWVDNFLAFPGRIAREDWVEQAKTLARGEVTDFAKRVDKGDINYKS